jgi:hypothetical protein
MDMETMEALGSVITVAMLIAVVCVLMFLARELFHKEPTGNSDSGSDAASKVLK